ncbi:hypothetical protein RRG08_013171 [Elysia crispata]|uniref:Uncharacterized protein n=1 Tax=Elysia crispata TaxID=231223 RepID=A0AAE1A0X3_9GAST|nr:hypothetical protein RRG08_013171 [Elysia crispata]
MTKRLKEVRRVWKAWSGNDQVLLQSDNGNQDFVSLSLRYYTTTKVGRVRVTTTGLCDPYFVVTTSLECLTLDVGQTEVVTRDQHTKNGFCVMCMQIYTFLIQRLQILKCIVNRTSIMCILQTTVGNGTSLELLNRS